jgi:hypothetical protein
MRTTPSDICSFAAPPRSAMAASKPRTSARKSRTGSLLALPQPSQRAAALALRPPRSNGAYRDQLFGGVTWPRISPAW